MLELHIANKNYSSWSLRPWLLMTALGVPFAEKVHFFTAPGVPNGFSKVSPTGKMPVLYCDGMVIWDSLAIAEFLAETYPSVWPTDKTARAWARSVCAEMHSGFTALRSSCPMSVGVTVKLKEVSPAVKADIERIETIWNEGLQRFKGPWLAGETFSAVDAFFGPVAFRFQTYGIKLQEPAQSYLERLLQHPAMQQWHQDALKEGNQEEAHEANVRSAGEILEDRRL